ncbi:MAG: ImmA/IrrE family metallo-endopeptidase [Coriobacteriia bacterium]|nr:ImmA/IrrE family metallo-endopeptidase [Coriobacteriia bacterium]
MELRAQAYYRQVAESALAKAGVTEPPVPVTLIIESLGIPILPVNLPIFFTAATINTDGLPTMVVNYAHSEATRREALSHMLGHMLLLLDDNRNVFPRDKGEHEEADIVSRELTMPSNMVIEQSRLWFNDFRYLARLFGVGEAAMLERMRELGMVNHQQGIRWDY